MAALAAPMFAQNAPARIAVIDVQQRAQSSAAGKAAYESLKKMQDDRVAKAQADERRDHKARQRHQHQEALAQRRQAERHGEAALRQEDRRPAFRAGRRPRNGRSARPRARRSRSEDQAGHRLDRQRDGSGRDLQQVRVRPRLRLRRDRHHRHGDQALQRDRRRRCRPPRRSRNFERTHATRKPPQPGGFFRFVRHTMRARMPTVPLAEIVAFVGGRYGGPPAERSTAWRRSRTHRKRNSAFCRIPNTRRSLHRHAPARFSSQRRSGR